MKKSVSILILFLFIIAACTIEQIIVFNYLEGVKNELEIIQQEYSEITEENKTKLFEKVSSLSNSWNKKENILCFFVDHNDIKDLGGELIKAKNAIKEEDTTIYNESINLSLFYLDGYTQFMYINFRSIF